MQRQPNQFVIITLAALLLQACSWFRDKPPEYMASREIQRLDVPSGLDEPEYRAPLVIRAPRMRLPAGDELNPGPPRVVATAGAGDTNAFLSWSAEGVYLQVRDTPSSVARRLGFAIERAGMQLLEKGAEGHRFEYAHILPDERSWWQKLAFWADGDRPNHSGTYRTRLVPDGEGTRVYLYFDSGEPATTAAAEHVLGIFMERLG